MNNKFLGGIRSEVVADMDTDYQLSDSLTRTSGRVFLTGTQALVRLLISQKKLDLSNGLNTGGFVSGYRGSPLGAFDQELWRVADLLKENGIEFLPAVNEELAATAILGTQQVESDPTREVTGVFSMWYGKGPGVDRAGDALKHGNAYGSSPHGGVLIVLGDDHGCISSSMPHQSEQALIAASMPVVNPANIGEYIEFGLNAWAMSRFSGAWIGFKAISETVESGAAADIEPLPSFKTPENYEIPATGLHYRWPDFPSLTIEERMSAKLEAVLAFARANPIDKFIVPAPVARLGIIAVGKAYLDLMEALNSFGIGLAQMTSLGIRLYKPGLTFPIETMRLEKFSKGLDAILIVEEKGPVVEQQVKNFLYNRAQSDRPPVWGKTDGAGASLLSALGELRPNNISTCLTYFFKFFHVRVPHGSHWATMRAMQVQTVTTPKRVPYFCSGCPHNTSTRVPEGSRAMAGVGCHFMASWMERNTGNLTQMGGEGVNWCGASRFLKEKHVFQNLGDGTYFHSGHLAVRQAVAAKSNITFKILYNHVVAMTGGQPIDGSLTILQIVQQVLSEGVKKVVVVTDQTQNYPSRLLPSHVPVYNRQELDAVQRQLRDMDGVTVLIYDQTCAIEKRRRWKQSRDGQTNYFDQQKSLFINSKVCEGCSDCSTQSNCLSIQPLETELGRKRQIHQSSCNKDYACADGHCPAFVSIYGGTPKKSAPKAVVFPDLKLLLKKYPAPTIPSLDVPYQLLIAGIGGTGVVTLGSLIATAAFLEGKGVSTLDFTGFAQKGGAVISHVRFAQKQADLHQVRIDHAQSDFILACDLVVATRDDVLQTLQPNTRILANLHIAPTADFVLNSDVIIDAKALLGRFQCKNEVLKVDAQELAERFFSDSILANVLLLGYAWQKGLIPIRLDALLRSIDLHKLSKDLNKKALLLGCLVAADAQALTLLSVPEVIQFASTKTLDEIIEFRRQWLENYQNINYANKYIKTVRSIEAKEVEIEGAESKRVLAKTVARSLFKLMAYKDEYEIARLYSDPSFLAELQSKFAGSYQVVFNLNPPLLTRLRGNVTNSSKMEFGSWMMYFFKVLARLKFLRGTVFDLFAYTRERKEERALRDEYFNWADELLLYLTKENKSVAVELARLPDQVRGFGHVKSATIRIMKLERGVLREKWTQEFR